MLRAIEINAAALRDHDRSSANDSDLLAPDEFAAAAVSHLHHLRAAARRLVRNSADADDLVQETYRLAFQHSGELRSLEHCHAWLQRILHRQAVTRYRHLRAAPPMVAVDMMGGDGESTIAAECADDEVLDQVSLQEVRRVIDSLPAELRLVVILCDIEGFTYAEIAALSRVPVGTVRSRIARARARLMRKLKTHAAEWGIRQWAS